MSAPVARPVVPEGPSTLELKGLTDEAARARLAQDGPNELPTEKKRGLLVLLFEILREPMFLMLVAAGALYVVMGESGRRRGAGGLRAPRDGHHHRPGAAHRAGPGRPARSLKPARAGDS